MKKSIAALAALLPLAAGAQTALDAYQISRGDYRGTARFTAMGGAFTALGGDLTTLGQNPGGIGVYRNSEIGATLDIDIQKADAQTSLGTFDTKQTKAGCNNFGYIGSVRLGTGTLRYLNWGVSYGRVTSFNRAYRGTQTADASLSNYIAGYTAAEEWTTKELNGYATGYDPYYDSKAPWMSILAYNSYAINPTNLDATDYAGLYNGRPGTALFDVIEKGYVDEYNINLGGNILDKVYWGFGFGITDIEYTNSTYYQENFDNAVISTPDAKGRTTGTAEWGLESWKHIYGTGWNFKVGVIVKPVDELRLGFAIHTPTYYNLNYDGWAQTNYNYSYPSIPNQRNLSGSYPVSNSGYGADDYFAWKLRSPWRFMVGAAGVIARRAIVSADYEYRPYNSMIAKDQYGVQYNDVKGDINLYYRSQNILRLGAELRLTPQWSLRAGYVFESSPVASAARDGNYQVYTSGPDDTETQPSFIFDNTTNIVSAGIGWHYSSFYIDATYVHKIRKSDWQAFTNYYGGANATDWIAAPRASITNNDNHIVLSAGFKF